jgi:hypothetical protein
VFLSEIKFTKKNESKNKTKTPILKNTAWKAKFSLGTSNWYKKKQKNSIIKINA